MTELIDNFGRQITYARLSVTDRCDFRCVYCMAEEMTFLPRQSILSLEEFYLVAQALVANGVKKIRITGGEPLVRKNILWLIEKIASLDGLDELAMTSNGSQLSKMSTQLFDAGLSRLNISIDSLQTDKFKLITRTGELATVLDGIDAAIAAGFKNTKINSVILNNRNDDEITDLLRYAIDRELDISYIEEMPLGEIVEHDRALSYCSSETIKETISKNYQLQPLSHKTNGPSRYFGVANGTDKVLKTKVGFISPHSNNFCSECNRIRLTAEGRLLFCLGNEHSIDLRDLLRKPDLSDDNKYNAVSQALRDNIHLKPEKHHFDLEAEPDIVRFMNMTGG